jgi:hypothetical protein
MACSMFTSLTSHWAAKLNRLNGGKSVYHVSERVFRMSPVYTPS